MEVNSKRGKVITIANEKGGVAKTTSAGAIGSALSQKGYKTILCDLDPQGDLTATLSVDAEERNMFDCLFKHKKLMGTRVNENLVLIGGSPHLNPVEFMEAVSKDRDYEVMNKFEVLKFHIDKVINSVDFIILDCPPNKEIITKNSLIASDYLLIPSEANSLSTNGIHAILEMLEYYNTNLAPNLKLLGIFLTRFRTNTSIHSDINDVLNKSYPDCVLKTRIHENITLQEAVMVGKELIDYQKEKESYQLVKNSTPFRGLKDYTDLTEEILKRIANG